MPLQTLRGAIALIFLSIFLADAQDTKFFADIINTSLKKLEKIIETESAQRKAGDQAILDKVAKSGVRQPAGVDSVLHARVDELASKVNRATITQDSIGGILAGIHERIDSLSRSGPDNRVLEMAEMLKTIIGELKATTEKAEPGKPAETAGAPKDVIYPKIDVGGTLFIHYCRDIGTAPSIGNDGFSVDRAYIDLKAGISGRLSGRVTVDLDWKDSTYKFMYLKYGYAEYGFGKSGFALRAGQIETPWIGRADKIWNYRCVEKSLSDYNKILNSADIGLSASYAIPGGYGDAVLQVINGNGYKNVKSNAEKNFQKDIAAAISIKPSPKNKHTAGLSLMAGFQYKNDASHPSAVTTGLLSFKHTRFSAGAEALGATKRDTSTKAENLKTAGYSIFGDVPLPFHPEAGLVCRYDFFDPDNTVPRDGASLLIVGTRYHPGPKNVVSIVLERQAKEKEDSKPVAVLKASWETKF